MTGEAVKPVVPETPTPTDSATPGTTEVPVEPVVPEERVELPSIISGQTAAQVTCTQPQR